MSHCPAYPEDWPTDRDAIRFVATSAPGPKGRQFFHALFWRDGRRQSLSQLGRLNDHARRAQAEGRTVEVIEFEEVAA